MEEEFVPAGRSVDIELGGQEVITIDLDNLDPDPHDVLDLLKDGDCKVWVWTKLAGEYWRRGYLDAAESITNAGIDAFQQVGNDDSLPPLLSLKANLQLAHARRAPKILLSNAREDILPVDQKTKEQYFNAATSDMNRGLSIPSVAQYGGGQLAFLTRGILQLDTRLFDEAMRTFEQVLSDKPTNIVALFGKARILYTRRNYAQALQTFQLVLRYSPNCQPDPRIGIGLCFWAMDNKAKAKAAWERSLEVNPSEWAAQLLLGLEAINSSKDTSQPDAERTHAFVTGTKLVESAFKLNQKNASAANALCELFIQKGNLKRATKLAERTVQFADTLTVLTEGHLRSARIAHSEGDLVSANAQYKAASEKQSKHPIAAIGVAQMQMNNDEMAGAIHTLDTLLQPPNPQKCNEAVVMLASLRAFPRPGVSSSDIEKERMKARELFDRITKTLESDDLKANGHGQHGGNRIPRALADDMAMYVEIAKLWQSESLERTTKALKEALRIGEASGSIEPRILNNLGALHHLEERYADARVMYEKALTTVSSMTSENAESMSTSILYNLARVYEDQEDDALAKEAYDKLLSRHPEYNDAKLRQAKLLCNINRNNDAHELLKQALTAQSGNLNLRAFYTYFLIQSNLPKLAKDFVFATLKEYDRHDVYSLCAAGWIMYHQARETRETTPEAIKDRKRGFQRSADFYEKALQLDPCCAFAAQGLAIVTAEDALGSLTSTTPSADEVQKRMNNAREALDIFAKVRESISDGSVYLNIGHCHYSRDEFDRAIESYETASVRFYKGQNVPVLLCLCRSWYAKAMKDQSYPAICKALECAQKALHVQPNDKAILYNIAMIQQKSAEMLFSLKPEKRKLEDLTRVIEQASHAQRLFASLASDPAPVVPYSRDIADNRRKYGDNMLKKGDDQLAAQRKYEDETKARLDAARAKRQEDRDRLEAAERERMEVLRQEAEKLAEQRRHDREQALEWTREVKMDSDDEKEKKPKKTRRPKPESAAVSGDESEPPKKKRRGKLRKAGGELPKEEEEEEEAIFSDDEDAEKPTKKRPKKRVVRDDDEEEASAPSRKKQYKSKEVLSDTDDEDMEG